MKRKTHKLLYIVFILLCLTIPSQAQSILGTWKTVDDETGAQKALVKLYKDGEKIYGQIVEIFDETKRDLPCKFCEGDDHNKPILGLNIIKDMEKDGAYYRDGTITDPQNGKVYTCRLKLTDDPDVLQVRGYVTFFYQTQYWERVK